MSARLATPAPLGARQQARRSAGARLARAVAELNLDLAKSALAEGADPNGEQLQTGSFLWGLTMLAARVSGPAAKPARESALAMAQALLEAGADPNKKDIGGSTRLPGEVFLELASRLDCEPMTRLLLSFGANADRLNARGETALRSLGSGLRSIPNGGVRVMPNGAVAALLAGAMKSDLRAPSGDGRGAIEALRSVGREACAQAVERLACERERRLIDPGPRSGARAVKRAAL